MKKKTPPSHSDSTADDPSSEPLRRNPLRETGTKAELMIFRRQSNDAGRRRSRNRATSRRLVVETLSQRRVLAAITGTVFNDSDASMHRNAAESGLIARVVYLDQNDNQSIDADEAFALTAADGSFRFDDLSDGEYRVAVFNGSASQVQTTPASAQTTLEVNSLAGAKALLTESGSLIQTDNSVVSVDLASGLTNPIALPAGVSDAARLPDGTVLASIAGDAVGATAHRLDPSDGTIDTIDLSGGTAAPGGFASVAIDDTGSGLAIESSINSLVPIRRIDASSVDGSDPNAGITVSVTSTNVDPNTEIHQSPAATRSLLALPTVDGYSVSLWSNATGTMITASPVELVSTISVAAFDDSSGLLAMRTDAGKVKFFDVDDNFSALYEFDHDSGPVSIDAARDRVLALKTDSSTLSVIDLQTGAAVAESAVDVSGIGTVTALTVDPAGATVVALGDSGLNRSQLTQRKSALISIDGGADVSGVTLGLLVTGDNQTPQFDSSPTFSTAEDVPLSLDAPGVLAGASDSDGDAFIVLARSAASSGQAAVSPGGSLTYVPDADFNGADSIRVVLHDGRGQSAETQIALTVSPVPDDPTAIIANFNPLVENLAGGEAFGLIDIVDADGFDHVVTVDDSRFEFVGNQIQLTAAAGDSGAIDYESEPTIPVLISATDNETGTTVTQLTTIIVQDANDPITGITPAFASVKENIAGELVAELEVVDQDAEQFHFLSVDDDRFIVDDFDLRLANGVALDREAEPIITVNVTAVEIGGENSFTQEITITVLDVPEQPSGMSLTNATVRELVPGDSVGDVLLDNAPPDDRFEFTTDNVLFEVVDGHLKLTDGTVIERSQFSNPILQITATDTLGQFAPITETFSIDVLVNDYPSHNVDNPYDVDHGGVVTPGDALTIINYIRIHGPGPVGSGGSLLQCYDVNGDGAITVLDALLVINHINRTRNSSSTGGGLGTPQGESLPEPDPSSAPEGIAIDEAIDTGLDRAGQSEPPLEPPRFESLGSDERLVSTEPADLPLTTPRTPQPADVDDAFSGEDEDDGWRLV